MFLGQVEYLDETRSKILVRRNLTIWRAAIYCTLVVRTVVMVSVP
jgi:hypothetical protein